MSMIDATHKDRGYRDPANRPDKGPKSTWEPVVTDAPVVTYATAHDGACLTIIAGVRCPLGRFHDGPCRIRTVSETGVAFTLAAGQRDTTAEPGWHPDLNDSLARAHDVAVALEQQVAAVMALHTARDYGVGEPHAVQICDECMQPSPCATVRALGADVLDNAEEGVPA